MNPRFFGGQNPHFLSVSPVEEKGGITLSGLPVFEEEREVFGYEIQSPLRGHSLQGIRESVYLRLQGGEDLVKERPEGGSPGLLLGICLFLCHIYLWIIYLRKDTISYRILQVITGYYTITPVEVSRSSGKEWRELD